MINRLLVVFLFSLTMCHSQVDKISNEILLQGVTREIPDSTKLFITDVLTNQVIDSSMVISNKFTFNLAPNNPPSFFFLHTSSLSHTRLIWLEDKDVLFDASKAPFNQAEITGSESQKIADQIASVTDTIRNPFRKMEVELELIKQFPASIVSASLLSIYAMNTDKNKVEEIYENFTEENKRTVFGQRVARFIKLNGNPQIGDSYIDFNLSAPEGDILKLSDHLGKITLLEFWASWCGPCRKENPNLVRTFTKYNPKGFEIFAVSADTDQTKWIDAIDKDGLSWAHVSDLEGPYNKAGMIYGVGSIPQNFLIDSSGTIVSRNLRGEALDQKLSELLGGQ